VTGRDELTDAEREALVDWWDSDWPDTVGGVIGTLQDVVARIVAGRTRAAVADAWDEGYDAGGDDLFPTRNPYRITENGEAE
jgi:hypothetical protein